MRQSYRWAEGAEEDKIGGEDVRFEGRGYCGEVWRHPRPARPVLCTGALAPGAGGRTIGLLLINAVYFFSNLLM
jgi:hypothetical protein